MGKCKYFAVCTTGRSGSTYLCDLLRNTKVAGMSPNCRSKKNVNVYFEKMEVNRNHLQSLDWDRKDLKGAIKELFEETASDNGVCSFKMMYRHILHISRTVREYDRYRQTCPGNVGKYFPDGMKAVFLTRRSKLRQALSRMRAMGKHTWHLYEGDEKIPDRTKSISYGEISSMMMNTKWDERSWRKFFRQNGIPYMQVEYESLVEDKDAVIKSIFRFLGIPYPKGHVLESGLVRQSDELTEKLVEKFSSPWRKLQFWTLLLPHYLLFHRLVLNVYEWSYLLKMKSRTYERLIDYVKNGSRKTIDKKSVVLLVSAMRSGSTLLKSLLANAPDVSYLPETDFQHYNEKNYWKLGNFSKSRIIVLKKPAWYSTYGDYPKISIPCAKKIVLVRDVYDTVTSLKSMNKCNRLDNTAIMADNESLVKYWCRVYRNIINHPSLKGKDTVFVKYEDLVRYPKKTTKLLFDFIGSCQKTGVETYRPPRKYKWKWGRDDAGEMIRTLKVQNVRKDRSDRKLLKVIRNSREVAEIRKHFDYEEKL